MSSLQPSVRQHKINLFGLAETRSNYSNTGATGYGLNFLELDELSMITNTTGNGEERIPSISGNGGQSRLVGFVEELSYDYDNRYLWKHPFAATAAASSVE